MIGQTISHYRIAATYRAASALREAIVGNTSLAKQQAQAAIALSSARDVEAISAIALAQAGDSAQATRLADDLNKRFPENTIAQAEYLPMIGGAAALEAGKPDKATETLAASIPNELGSFGLDMALYPVYLRGEAYLGTRQGAAAAAEFQKILDHSCVVQNEPIGALAHLGLARAYALARDNANSRTAYQDSLPSGRTPIPTSPSCSKPKPSTRSSNSLRTHLSAPRPDGQLLNHDARVSRCHLGP